MHSHFSAWLTAFSFNSMNRIDIEIGPNLENKPEPISLPHTVACLFHQPSGVRGGVSADMGWRQEGEDGARGDIQRSS